jgi:hypothetical protein
MFFNALSLTSSSLPSSSPLYSTTSNDLLLPTSPNSEKHKKITRTTSEIFYNTETSPSSSSPKIPAMTRIPLEENQILNLPELPRLKNKKSFHKEIRDHFKAMEMGLAENKIVEEDHLFLSQQVRKETNGIDVETKARAIAAMYQYNGLLLSFIIPRLTKCKNYLGKNLKYKTREIVALYTCLQELIKPTKCFDMEIFSQEVRNNEFLKQYLLTQQLYRESTPFDTDKIVHLGSFLKIYEEIMQGKHAVFAAADDDYKKTVQSLIVTAIQGSLSKADYIKIFTLLNERNQPKWSANISDEISEKEKENGLCQKLYGKVHEWEDEELNSSRINAYSKSDTSRGLLQFDAETVTPDFIEVNGIPINRSLPHKIHRVLDQYRPNTKVLEDVYSLTFEQRQQNCKLFYKRLFEPILTSAFMSSKITTEQINSIIDSYLNPRETFDDLPFDDEDKKRHFVRILQAAAYPNVFGTMHKLFVERFSDKYKLTAAPGVELSFNVKEDSNDFSVTFSKLFYISPKNLFFQQVNLQELSKKAQTSPLPLFAENRNEDRVKEALATVVLQTTLENKCLGDQVYFKPSIRFADFIPLKKATHKKIQEILSFLIDEDDSYDSKRKLTFSSPGSPTSNPSSSAKRGNSNF